MKKGIIFDMDGTLWDSAAEVAESWNETVKRAGYDRKPITVKDIQSVMGKTMDVIARLSYSFGLMHTASIPCFLWMRERIPVRSFCRKR